MSNLVENNIQRYIDIIQGDQLFKELFENMFEGALIVNADRQIIYFNQSAEMITGYEKEEIINLSCNNEGFRHYGKSGEALGNNDYLMSRCLEKGIVITKKGAIPHKSGVLVPVLITVIPIKDANSRVIGALELMLDDSAQDDLDRAHEQLKQAAIKDALTNLYTRSEVMERINIEIEKSDRYEVPVCLCVCDIDDFKKLNEKHGNHAGDVVLRTIGEIIVNNLRRTDIVARFGGEEFLILLPLIDLHRANIAIEKLKRAIDNAKIDIISPQQVTLSYGLTEIVKNDTLEEFIDRAESALYKAKKLGKNRIEMFT